MTDTLHNTLAPPTPLFAWPTLPLDGAALNRYLAVCEADGVGYRLGAKADDAGRSLTEFPPRYAQVDCSGWVRAALAYATRGGVVLPDGSVNQRDWCAAQGLKVSAPFALGRDDGALRIAFIVPNARHPVGHVYLCRNGRTLESWGGHGPGSRSWLTHALHLTTTAVFVLTPPG